MTTVLPENVQNFGPSIGLMTEFGKCSRDPSEAIVKRLKQMLNIFLHHYQDGDTDTKAKAEKCSNESQSWYYAILENLVHQEKRRLGIKDSSHLLEHDPSQRSLVACCLEIATYLNGLPCDFPLLLHILDLVPFDFWKVIEPLLRSGVSFPPTVRRHLSQVENQTLEILVWTRDSPLWELIRVNGGGLPTCMEVRPAAKTEDPTQTDVHVAPNASAAGSNISTPQSSGQQQKSKSLQLFSRKVYMLMDKRLTELSAALNIQDELQLKIWTCFEHSLVHCTSLMENRHLDQMLLCAIYSMAQNTGNGITFKHIKQCYKSQEHTSKTVLKNVLISDGVMGSTNDDDLSPGLPTPDTPSAHYPKPRQEERGKLILFFNQVYWSRMSSYVTQFDSTAGGETPHLSVSPKVWRATRGQQQPRIRCTRFTSPLNTESSTQRPDRHTYIVNSSSSKVLQNINNMVRSGSSRRRQHRVISLNMENEEPQGDEGPSAKRSYLSVEGVLQRRMRALMNDRANVANQDHSVER